MIITSCSQYSCCISNFSSIFQARKKVKWKRVKKGLCQLLHLFFCLFSEVEALLEGLPISLLLTFHYAKPFHGLPYLKMAKEKEIWGWIVTEWTGPDTLPFTYSIPPLGVLFLPSFMWLPPTCCVEAASFLRFWLQSCPLYFPVDYPFLTFIIKGKTTVMGYVQLCLNLEVKDCMR